MRRFERPDLANEISRALRGKALVSDAPNGLFLAAPRRTGKSTFLQGDLKPQLERDGITTVYVDLWSDQRRDPGLLIAEAVGKALLDCQGLVAKAAKAASLDHVGIPGWLKIDTTKIGRIDGTTIVDALKALREASKKPVALIIDEAQHALTSDDGEAVMAALKSSRDQMNKPGEINLMLVMSGSDRDKLLRLVNSASAPFFGSTINHLRELDSDFVDHVVALIEKERGDLVPIDGAKLLEAFRLFANRPQFFIVALERALSPVSASSERFEDQVLALAKEKCSDEEAQMEAEYLGLRPLEQAVLWCMLERGQGFRPYNADSLRFYADKLGGSVTPQQVQNAVDALRERTPALVWKSARGEYAVDDAAMHRWYRRRLEAGTWPPTDPQMRFPDVPSA